MDNNTLKEQLQAALDILGMKKNASRAMINSRARRLKADYRNSDEHDNQSGQKMIDDAEALLIGHIDLLPELDTPDSSASTESSKYDVFKKVEKPKKEKKPINYKLIVKVLVPIFLLSAVITPIIMIRNNREETYLELTAMMEDFTYGKVDKIEDYINRLPEGYKDVHDIESEYRQIVIDVEVLESGDIEYDYEAMRVAYYRLEDLTNASDDWDLTRYLDRFDNLLLILGIRWSDDSYYFHLLPGIELNVDTSEYWLWLCTDLPDERQPGIEYRFYHAENFTTFGSVNTDDKYDYFTSYRLISLNRDEITLYVFKTLERVTLYAQDE